MTRISLAAEVAAAAEQLHAAREALARADADAAYWMEQYRRCVEDVRVWVEAARADERDSAPRYRLLQQTLQDTRYGLDYAVRCASDARQEMTGARQFYLDLLAARTAAAGNGGTGALDSEAAASSTSSTSPAALAAGRDHSPGASAAPFRIRTNAVAPPLQMQPPLAPANIRELDNIRLMQDRLPPSTASAAPVAAVQEAPQQARQAPDAGAGARPATVNPSQPRPATGVRRLSPLKRGAGETIYVVPPKRAKYPRTFKWDDNLMHHFPKDFTLPVCSLSTMWTYWVCGDPVAKYPPFRILIAPELEEAKTKRMLSSLRFVMLEIETRLLANGAWVNNPTPEDATKMLEVVKDSIAVRPAAKRGDLQPVEQLQWTSLGRIIRAMKKMIEEEEEQEEGENEEEGS